MQYYQKHSIIKVHCSMIIMFYPPIFKKKSNMVHVPIFKPLQKFLNAAGEDRNTFVTSSHGKHFFTLKSFWN